MPTTGKNQRLASFNVNETDWEAFKEKAKANGTSASKLLQELISSYLGNSTQVTDDAISERFKALEKRIEALEGDSPKKYRPAA